MQSATPVTPDELISAVGHVELGLKLDIGNLRHTMDTRFGKVDAQIDEVRADILRVEQNMYAMLAPLLAHFHIPTPELQDR